MINVSVIGANGYTGLQLLTLLASHKEVKLAHAVSRSHSQKEITELYPSLLPFAGRRFEDLNLEILAGDTNLCFTCLPHGTSGEICSKLYHAGVKIVDLSADFRYDDVDTYREWYKVEHCDKALNKIAVYGLSEIYRKEIQKASIIGNPGCYTTCSILPLYPLLKEKRISSKGIVIDAKSGTSGAGRKAAEAYSFTELDENFKAYSVATHRHTSEIEEQLSVAAASKILLNFTPHLLPVKRGILSTIYADCIASPEEIAGTYEKYYGKSLFVKPLRQGLPELKYVVGSNYCMIGFTVDPRTEKIIIVSAIDNLIKGASGQAIQNMNLMYGFREDEGLTTLPSYL